VKKGVNVWTGSSGSGLSPVAGFCEHDDEPSGSIKAWEFLDYLCDNFSKTVLHLVIYLFS
jgi:hypothetical protein